MSGRLAVCATPIGNLEDVTLRVLRVLRGADVIACEDTRRTRVLLERHGIAGGRRLVSYHEHNERARAAELVERIRAGAVVALATDAGTPLLSDPGWVLVDACLEAGIDVEALPGPSAITAALVVAGLATDRYTFVGFLPRRAAELRSLWLAEHGTLVAFESPRRLAAALTSLAAVAPARRVAVCRELTKLHEEVVRGPAGELAARFAATSVRGEITLVVGSAEAAKTPLEPAVDALARLVEAGAKPRRAAGVVAELTGLSANELYAELTTRDKG